MLSRSADLVTWEKVLHITDVDGHIETGAAYDGYFYVGSSSVQDGDAHLFRTRNGRDWEHIHSMGHMKTTTMFVWKGRLFFGGGTHWDKPSAVLYSLRHRRSDG